MNPQRKPKKIPGSSKGNNRIKEDNEDLFGDLEPPRYLYPDEGRILILATVLQAERDLLNYLAARTPKEKEIWGQAYGLLFDDEYLVDWHDDAHSTEELLSLLGINIEWLRRKIRAKLKIQIERRDRRRRDSAKEDPRDPGDSPDF